jgi:hypothetical protein
LPVRGKVGNDFSDVVDEAHIEHPVGFIEHEDFHRAEPERVAPHEVEQTSRRGDEHVDAVEQRTHLGAHGHPADRQRGADAKMAAVGVEAVAYLAGQFPRRAEHQNAAGLALRPSPLGEQPMQDRQRERRGLSGAGLRDPDHVAARQHKRNGLDLDRRGRDVVLLGERARDRFGEPEIMKRGQ